MLSPRLAPGLQLLVSTQFQILFTPIPGFFSPFPHGTSSLSVTAEYLALGDGPPGFQQDFSCPVVLGIPLEPLNFSCTGLSPSLASFPIEVPLSSLVSRRGPATPPDKSEGLGCFGFARHYYRNRYYFLFLRLLRCFSSAGCPPSINRRI